MKYFSLFSLIALAISTFTYAGTIRTSDFGGDISLAISAASDGDKIIVDVPSPPGMLAFVDKKLAISGSENGCLNGRIVLRFDPSNSIDASGTSISHLNIKYVVGPSGIGIFGSSALGETEGVDDVTIQHCSIEGFRSGIRGRFSDGWQIHHNVIISNDPPVTLAFLAGISIAANCNNWSIHHNVISAEMKGIFILNGAPDIRKTSNIVIMQNVIMTADDNGIGVALRARDDGSVQENIEIKHNDLTDTGIPVIVFASSVTENAQADAGAFVLDTTLGDGVIENLNVRKNDW